MSSCEKCWEDAARVGCDYKELVAQRDRMFVTCTPEERAGKYAEVCPKCNRKTIHQHTGDCMVCGRDISNSEVTQGLKEMLDEME